tara:strand:- start:2511 stop:4838 length:2328 start_codon:yes stop_codon:yes gene_type:complete
MAIPENQANDDNATSTGSNPGSPLNTAQQGVVDQTAGTNTTTSKNIGGSGNAQSNANAGSESAPGRRLKNPLASLASYNYQISLYMITPDAYDAFTASGRTNIEALQTDGAGGAFLIAQSGGINNNNAKRAPGFEFDYYIDNLEMSQMVSGKADGSASNISDLAFTITEPYGFSFIQKLKEASEALQAYTADLGYSKGTIRNPSKQFFILGVNFLGYDINGTPVSGDMEIDNTLIDISGANGTSLFQTYYDIMISKIDFKIDGKIVTYKCSARSIAPTLSFGVKRGRIPMALTLTAETIEEAMANLTAQLNNQQQLLLDAGFIEVRNTFESVFVGEGSEGLKKAKLVTPEDVDKFKWKGANAKNSQEATIATEVKSVPDSSKRLIAYAQNSSLLEIFDDLIKQSTYLRDAMTTLYTTALTPDLDKKDSPLNNPDAGKSVGWYHVTAEMAKAVWDPLVADWAYHTRYVFETYQTPVISSAYVNPGMNYYGPHKRYDYWYTGKNSEVLKYEQQLDNLYYNIVLGQTVAEANAKVDSSAGVKTSGDVDSALVVGQSQEGPKLGKLGKGNEAQNAYVTSLYSPTDYGTAQVTILGDPDFIVQDQTSSIEDVYNRFYGTTGFNVNANGGQVFMEINFKEAVDYDEGTGVLELNDNILFWEYPENIANIVEGVSYQVVDIKSMFKNGTFTQNLDCVINTFPNSDASNANGNDEREGAEGDATQPKTATIDGGKATVSSTGLQANSNGQGNAAGAPVVDGVTGANDDSNDADTKTEDNGGRE